MIQLSNDKRKHWIDLLRGICMIAILLDHTEIYYTGDNIINYNFYVVNVLLTFFFISGYLFYSAKGFSFKHKLLSILRGIIMPYFIFTTAMSLPKALVHGYGWREAMVNILTGQASWFVAALAVAELLFSIILVISRGKKWILCLAAIFSYLGCVVLSNIYEHTFWQIGNALMAIPMLCIGYIYHEKEQYFCYFNRPRYSLWLFILVVLLKTIELYLGINLLIYPIHVSNFVWLAGDATLVTVFLVTIFQQLPRNKWIEWTGSHTIVYYFLCGGIPMGVGVLLEKLNFGYQGAYYRVIVAFLLVYLIATITTWIIYKYIPFVTGRLSN